MILHPSIPKDFADQIRQKFQTSISNPSSLPFKFIGKSENICNTVSLLPSSSSSKAEQNDKMVEYSFPRVPVTTSAVVVATEDIPENSYFSIEPLVSKSLTDFRGLPNNSENLQLLKRMAKICGIALSENESSLSSFSDDLFERLKLSVFARCWKFAEVLPLSSLLQSTSEVVGATAKMESIEPEWAFMDETVAAMTFNNLPSKDCDFDCWLCYQQQQAAKPVFILRSKHNIKSGEEILSDCFYNSMKAPKKTFLSALLSFYERDASVSQFIFTASQSMNKNSTTGGASSSSFSTAAVQARQMKRYQTLVKHQQLCPKQFNKATKISKNKRLFFFSDSKATYDNVTDPRYIGLTNDDLLAAMEKKQQQQQQQQDLDHQTEHNDSNDDEQLASLLSRADIVYLAHSTISKSDQFPNAKFISQFPEERQFVNKAELASTVNDNLGFDWKYLPKSFVFEANGKNNSVSGVTVESHFPLIYLLKQQQKNGAGAAENQSSSSPSSSSPLWIAKSTNLTRSMGHLILDSLPWLIRSNEAIPRVICEYIDRPLLVRGGKKFDVRFYVLVNSLGLFSLGNDNNENQQFESEIYLYKDIIPRVAGAPFSADNSTLHKNESHFTWSPQTGDWYGPLAPERLPDGQVFIDEFFNKEYGANAWQEKVMPQVKKMLKELFSKGVPLVGMPDLPDDLEKVDEPTRAACATAVENYWGMRKRFRGMYGCDVMIRHNDERDDQEGESASTQFTPVLLECTWSPNSQGPLRADKEFYNYVFNTLFRGEGGDKMERL